MSELYVKAWFLFVVIAILIVAVTGVFIYQGEAGKTQGLIKDITNDFNNKLITLQTNQSLALSEIAYNFAQLSENSTSKITEQAATIINLTLENDDLSTSVEPLKVENNDLHELLNTTIVAKNDIWSQYNDSTVPNAYHLHEPTNQEVIDFLVADLTTGNNSFDYACDIDYNASLLGIRCGVMRFNHTVNITRFVNVFDTSDVGRIYVDMSDTLLSDLLAYGAITNEKISW